MRDPEIAAALVAGDPRGLESVWSDYADRLHDYARTLLGPASHEAAADIVHASFVTAQGHASELAEPDLLRAWLYAVVRAEVRRAHKSTRPGRSAGEASLGNAAAEREALVVMAAESLSPHDRELFELSLRHGLSVREVAEVLRISEAHAADQIREVTTSFENALGALTAARQGDGCRRLGSLMTSSPKARKRHLGGCARCARAGRQTMTQAALVAVHPFAPAPGKIRERLLSGDALVTAWAQGVPEGVWDASGFPRGETTKPSRRPALLAAAAVVLLMFGLAESARLVGNERPEAAPDRTDTSSPDPVRVVGDRSTLKADPTTRIPDLVVLTDPMLDPDAPKVPVVDVVITQTPEAPAPGTTAPPTHTPPPGPPPSTSGPAPVPAGTLAVSQTSLTLSRSGLLTPNSRTIRLTANGGPVSWGTTVDSKLSVSARSGTIPAGQHVDVRVTLVENDFPGAKLYLKFNGITVTVTVAL